MKRSVRIVAVAAVLAMGLSLAACSKPSSAGTGASGSAASSAPPSTPASAAGSSASGPAGSSSASQPAASQSAASTTPGSTAASASETASEKPLRIGFLGFSKANSFAQATWAGIQEYAKANNATATFLDGNFQGPTQVNQLQDAITAKRFDVVIVQANDGTAMVNPVKQAVAAGLTVVIEFTPVGGKYDTAQPQIPGTITVIDPPTVNGAGLAKMGLEACKTVVTSGKCQVAYLQGFANYPLDTARTNAAVDALNAGGAEVFSNLVGGYTQDSGRTAMQNLLQAHPDINVVIGSSQAIEGGAPLVKGKKIALVGNGGSTQAVAGVMSGAWFGTYLVPEKAEGAMAAKLGLDKARGQSVPNANVACEVLTTFNCLGTKTTLKGVTADYSD